jgi:hypothetical protein
MTSSMSMGPRCPLHGEIQKTDPPYMVVEILSICWTENRGADRLRSLAVNDEEQG